MQINKIRLLLRRARRLAEKVSACTLAERFELCTAVGGVLLVAVLLRTCPFQRVQSLLGSGGREPTLSDATERRILWAVAAVSRRLVPGRPCLTQALAAQFLLRVRGAQSTVLRIGVARGPCGDVQAHAWLERDGTILLGGKESATLYQPLSKSTSSAGRVTAHSVSTR